MLLFLAVIEDETARNKLEEIYYLYSKDLFYVAFDILNDYYEAEDVVQSSILKLSNHLENIVDVNCYRTKGFVVTIARNIAINIYNQRKRRVSVNIEEVENVLSDESDVNPELCLLRLDNGKRIAKQLASIKPKYADILTLKYTYEYSHREIAVMLNMSESNVRTKLTRARKALHDILGGEKYEWAYK